MKTNTILKLPFAVTRVVTHRLIVEFGGDGLLDWCGPDREQAPDYTHRLPVGRKVTARFVADTTRDCIAVFAQPNIWHELCRSESGTVLGTVDFPFLTSSAYEVYPQDQRTNTIEVVFEKLERGAEIRVEVDDGTGVKNVNRYPLADEEGKSDRFTVAFVGFSELHIVDEGATRYHEHQPRNRPMGCNAWLTFGPEGLDLPGPFGFGRHAGPAAG